MQGRRFLTTEQFQYLATVPPETEWFAHIANSRMRRAYRIGIHEFMRTS